MKWVRVRKRARATECAREGKNKENVREWARKEKAVTAGNAEREGRWAEAIKAVRALGVSLGPKRRKNSVGAKASINYSSNNN